eukprot:gene34673-biopygen35375
MPRASATDLPSTASQAHGSCPGLRPWTSPQPPHTLTAHAQGLGHGRTLNRVTGSRPMPRASAMDAPSTASHAHGPHPGPRPRTSPQPRHTLKAHAPGLGHGRPLNRVTRSRPMPRASATDLPSTASHAYGPCPGPRPRTYPQPRQTLTAHAPGLGHGPPHNRVTRSRPMPRASATDVPSTASHAHGSCPGPRPWTSPQPRHMLTAHATVLGHEPPLNRVTGSRPMPRASATDLPSTGSQAHGPCPGPRPRTPPQPLHTLTAHAPGLGHG